MNAAFSLAKGLSRNYRRQAFVFVWLVVCAAMSGCAPSVKWTEDVLLPDSRVVTVARYQEFKGSFEIGQSPGASAYWLEFVNPDTKQLVSWKNDGTLSVIALFIHQEVPYLLVERGSGTDRRDFNCPDPPYFLHRFEGGSWNQIPLKEIPLTRLAANLTYVSHRKRELIEASNHHLSVEQTKLQTVSNMQPWIMDFSLLDKQTFGQDNCYKQSNYLLVKP
jgi:hypothetical protein